MKLARRLFWSFTTGASVILVVVCAYVEIWAAATRDWRSALIAGAPLFWSGRYLYTEVWR